jgi:hypothetical protein
MFFPQLTVKKEDILNFLQITNVMCKSNKYEENISLNNCQNCIHFKKCVIWNDKDFLKYYKYHKYCEKCNNQEEILNRGYVFICWRLQQDGLLSERYLLECCSCLRLHD